MGRRGAAAVVVTVTEIGDEVMDVVVWRVVLVVEEMVGDDDGASVVVVIDVLLLEVDVDGRTVGVGMTTSVSTITPTQNLAYISCCNSDSRQDYSQPSS